MIECKNCQHSQVHLALKPGVLVYDFECVRLGYYATTQAGLLEVHKFETGRSSCQFYRKGRK